MKKNPLDAFFKITLLVLAVVFVLIYLRQVLAPFFLSVFISLLLLPVCRFLETKGMRRFWAALLTMAVLFVLLGAVVTLTSAQVVAFSRQFPDIIARFQEMVHQFTGYISSHLGFTHSEQIAWIQSNAPKLVSGGSGFLGNFFAATTNVLISFSLIPIYMFFILWYRNHLKRFLIAFGKKFEYENVLDVTLSIQYIIQQYVSGLAVVIVIVAALNSIGLLIIGIPFALVLGVISALLTIIPYIGIFIGAAIPTIVALVTKDSTVYPLAVIGLYVFVQFLEGNFITPNIVGRQVNINPLVAILSLLVGGIIWGVVGMILAVPAVAVVKITFRHINPMQPFALLLENGGKERRQQEESIGNDADD